MKRYLTAILIFILSFSLGWLSNHGLVSDDASPMPVTTSYEIQQSTDNYETDNYETDSYEKYGYDNGRAISSASTAGSAVTALSTPRANTES